VSVGWFMCPPISLTVAVVGWVVKGDMGYARKNGWG
jgi:hypothetical protein